MKTIGFAVGIMPATHLEDADVVIAGMGSSGRGRIVAVLTAPSAFGPQHSGREGADQTEAATGSMFRTTLVRDSRS